MSEFVMELLRRTAAILGIEEKRMIDAARQAFSRINIGKYGGKRT